MWIVIVITVGILIFCVYKIVTFTKTKKSSVNVAYYTVPKHPVQLPKKNSSILLIHPSPTENIISYAKVHKLDYVACPNDEKKKWSFIHTILDTSDYEYIFYLGQRMVIVNNDKQIDTLIHQAGDSDMILCRDENDHERVSIDAVIFRKTYWSLVKISHIYKMYKQGVFDNDLILDQLYVTGHPSLRKAKENLDKGFPYLLCGICVYNENAFNSSRSSFITNGTQSGQETYIYPWKPVDGYVELPKNMGNLPVNSTEGADQRIPKYIFQTLETNLVPQELYESSTKRWIEMNPGYQYFFFDAVDRREFIKNNCEKFVYEMYEKLIPGAYKADLWRYCVLHKYGGCYVDSQMVPLVPFNEIIENKLSFISAYDRFGDPFGILCGFLCCTPQHPILQMTIIDTCIMTFFDLFGSTTLDLTGPGRLGKSASRVMSYKTYPFNEGVFGDVKICSRELPYVTWKNKKLLRIKYKGYTEDKFIVLTGKEPYSILWKQGIVFKPCKKQTKIMIGPYEKLECSKIVVEGFTNPGICKHDGTYKILFRYWHEKLTKIFTAELKNNSVSDAQPLNIPPPSKCKSHTGFEDARAFTLNEDLCALTTARVSDCSFQPHMLNISKGTSQQITPLFEYDNKNVKNWFPFIQENGTQLYTVSINPHIIARIDNGVATVKNITTNDFLTQINHTPYFFRGSAGVVKTRIGLLGTGHIVLNGIDFSVREYQNFFYKVQETPPYAITNVSSFFKIDPMYQIEFLCGLTMGLDDNTVIMTFGIEDRDSNICFVTLDTIEKLFHKY